MAKNIARIAELMGAKIIGKVPDARGGAFGAAKLAADVAHLPGRKALRPDPPVKPGTTVENSTASDTAYEVALSAFADSISGALFLSLFDIVDLEGRSVVEDELSRLRITLRNAVVRGEFSKCEPQYMERFAMDWLTQRLPVLVGNGLRLRPAKYAPGDSTRMSLAT